MIVRPNTLPNVARLGLLLAGLLGALVLGTGCTIMTTRPLDPTTGKAIIGNEAEQFNAANYVTSIWESQVISVLDAAPDLNTVLTALKANAPLRQRPMGAKSVSSPTRLSYPAAAQSPV